MCTAILSALYRRPPAGITAGPDGDKEYWQEPACLK